MLYVKHNRLSPLVLFAFLILKCGEPLYGATQSMADGALAFYQTESIFKRAYDKFEDALARHRKEEGVTETQLRGLSLIGKRIYQGKNLLKVFTEAYAKLMPARDLNDLVMWQKTPTALKLTQGGLNLSLAPANKISAYFKKNSPTLLRPNRKNALNTFFKAFEQSATYASLEAGVDIGVKLGLSGYASASDREKVAQIAEKAEGWKDGYQGLNQNKWIVTNFFMLKEMRNDEIDEVSKFAMSITGQAHTQAYIKAMDATFLAAGKTLRDQVIRETAAASHPAASKH
jgi:hypothetical protein